MNREFLNNIDEYIVEHRYRLVNSIVVYQNGELIFERYYNKFNSESRNNIKSVWKSILSIVLGICIDKGFIKSVDEPIINYLPSFTENKHPYHKKITIKHLLTMSSGMYWNGGVHYHCPMFEQLIRSRDWLSHLSDIEMADLPGSKFMYKEWDVILLSAVIGLAAGMTSYEMCDKFLYQPLKIASGEWPKSTCGINYNVIKGEEQSDLCARDMAKIGLLFLQGGLWNGQQIVSESYIKEAIKPSAIDADYGYLWWLFDENYSCRGFGGQEINVYPFENIVTVVQATPTPSSKSYGDISNRIVTS